MSFYLKSDFDFENPKTVSAVDELPLWSAPFGFLLLEKIKLRKNIKALDIGCGTGFPLLELAERLGSSSKITGIDPWYGGVERIKEKIKVYGIANVELICGKAEKIPLEDNTIDLIVSNNGINNVENLDLVLSECNRIAKNNCQFTASMNLDGTMSEFYGIYKEVLKENNLTEELQKLSKHISQKRPPLKNVISAFEKNGFKVKEKLFDVFEYKYIDGTTMLNHHLIRSAFMGSWQEIPEEKDRERIFKQIEEKANTIANQKGCFKLSIPFVIISAFKE